MWKLMLCVMVAAWGGRVAALIGNNMNNISETLRERMGDVLDLATVNYSTPVINTTYVASVEFDMRAMGPIYNSTHIVIDAIANKQAYPEGFVKIVDGQFEIASPSKEWRTLLSFYAGPTAVVVVAALLVVILPCAGLFWCCCYWCRVGRRRRPFDRKYDSCVKGLLAIILIALLTLFLFGVVCAFATDSQVESGAAEAAGTVRASIHDAREFLNATQAHARWVLVVNYRELETQLKHMLYTSGLTVSLKLGEFSRAVSMTTLNRMVQQLGGVQADLWTVHNLTAVLRHDADQLNIGLRKVKNQILQTLMKCDHPKCLALKSKHNIGQLSTKIQYSQMPDVTELLNNVTSLLDGRIQEEVAEGQKVFQDIQNGIRRSVDEHIPKVQSAITETGRRLELLANEITYASGNASVEVESYSAVADIVQETHARYGHYRRWAGLGAAVALLLILWLAACGLVCGVCGKRPDVYGASDCCNKGAGSKCLLCGMGCMFLVGGACCALVVLYFLLGLAAQRALCDPATEPRGNRLFNDLEQFVDLEKLMFNERRDSNFNMASVIISCHNNETIYKTLHLSRLYDLESLRAQVGDEVTRRVAALSPLYPAAGTRVTILKDSAKRKLSQLADTGLSDYQFDRILDALETNMTSLALDSLARQLNSTARSLAQPVFAQEAADLLAASAALTRLHTDLLQPMLRTTALLNGTATNLRDNMKFNHSSLKAAITYLMDETAEAEVFFNTKGSESLQNMTREFASVIAGQLDAYLRRVAAAAARHVGRCGPLSNAFNATRDAACRKILMPANGYWMSLSWCVMLLVPLLVVSQRLARLYLHLDPYPGPLVEAEYLYDAYADRDNVPLANAYKAEKRSGREERRAGGGGGGGGGSGSGGAGGAGGARGEGARQGREGREGRADPAVAPPLDAHHARRYNDMAPKHWEEGPPRYHGPTEYERPPPYYYPGPNDRQ